MMKRHFIISVVACLFFNVASAFASSTFTSGAGSLDTSFGGGDGKVTQDIGSTLDTAFDVATDSSGNIYLLGYAKLNTLSDITLIKLNSAGTLDTTFGTTDSDGLSGIATTDFSGSSYTDLAYGLAIDSSDNLIVVGKTYYTPYSLYYSALGLYDSNGGLTTSKNQNFLPSFLTAEAVTLASDGGILIAGSTNKQGNPDFYLAKYDSALSATDSTFAASDSDSVNGYVFTDVSGISGMEDYPQSIAVSSSGQIVLAGYSIGDGTIDYDTDMALAIYSSTGALVTTFTYDFSSTSTDRFESVSYDLSGNIIAVGKTEKNGTSDFLLARLTSAGILDTTFGSSDSDGVDGMVISDLGGLGGTDWAYSVVVDTEGRYLVAGYSNGSSGNQDFVLARYTSAGVLDTSFGTNDSDGIDGVQTTDIGSATSDTARSIALTSSGKIIVAGYTTSSSSDRDFAVAQYVNYSCGDNQVDVNEDCDDGNTTSGDGCSSTCTTEDDPAPEPDPSENDNNVPTANAGDDKTITLDADSSVAVDLVGSGTDADGDTLTYSWNSETDSSLAINNSASSGTYFTATSMGDYTFRLTVTDPSGAADSDLVVFHVVSATADETVGSSALNALSGGGCSLQRSH